MCLVGSAALIRCDAAVVNYFPESWSGQHPSRVWFALPNIAGAIARTLEPHAAAGPSATRTHSNHRTNAIGKEDPGPVLVCDRTESMRGPSLAPPQATARSKLGKANHTLDVRLPQPRLWKVRCNESTATSYDSNGVDFGARHIAHTSPSEKGPE